MTDSRHEMINQTSTIVKLTFSDCFDVLISCLYKTICSIYVEGFTICLKHIFYNFSNAPCENSDLQNFSHHANLEGFPVSRRKWRTIFLSALFSPSLPLWNFGKTIFVFLKYLTSLVAETDKWQSGKSYLLLECLY